MSKIQQFNNCKEQWMAQKIIFLFPFSYFIIYLFGAINYLKIQKYEYQSSFGWNLWKKVVVFKLKRENYK